MVHIPATEDSLSHFFADVSTLLSVYRNKEDWTRFLRSLPQAAPAVQHLSSQKSLAHLLHGVRDFTKTRGHSGHAVCTMIPLHLCSNCVLCVICGASSFCTGLLHVFYLDVITSIMSSVLHKDVCVDLPGWSSRSRCWVVGTGEPGAGKSPCIDPIRKLPLDVFAEEVHMAPGRQEDQFHVCRKVRRTLSWWTGCAKADGYCLIFRLWRGRTIVVPSTLGNRPSASGTWDQAKYINYRFLGKVAGRSQWRSCFLGNDARSSEEAAASRIRGRWTS